jgi:hypothetical protein
MQNKKALMFLVPVALALMSVVVYKFYKALNPSKEQYAKVINTVYTDKADTAISADTFSIIADYRDPFLGKIISAEVPKATNYIPRQPKPEKPPLTPVKWPAITYGGVIKNQKSNKQVVLVSINGQGNFMKAGEEAQGILLKQVYKDSIVLVYEKETKVVRK